MSQCLLRITTAHGMLSDLLSAVADGVSLEGTGYRGKNSFKKGAFHSGMIISGLP